MLQKLKPITSSQRNLIKINYKHLRKKPLLKSIIEGKKNSIGRNNSGKITVNHKGGGHKKNYRKIEFFNKTNKIGVVTSIEYDPNRTGHIASVYDFLNKKYFYILAPEKLKLGHIIKSGTNAEIFLGHSLPISKIPEGTFIYNISPKKNKPSQICRAAGTYAQIIEKTSKYCKIKLRSGEIRIVSTECYVSIGTVSNELHQLKSIGKAGRSRWLNIRPTVRGVAMNPVDHPNGGGEGKKSGNGLTPWGKSLKNKKTSRSKNKFRIT